MLRSFLFTPVDSASKMAKGAASAADDIREGVAFACVVLVSGAQKTTAAETLFAHRKAELAYFKAPGFISFVETLPTTGTQTIQKHQIFASVADPRPAPGVIDLRHRKKRGQSPT